MTHSAQQEIERLQTLSSYNLDYNELQKQFEDLTLLATKIAGTQISLVNLIDAYNSWTIAQQGSNLSVKAAEEVVCYYTIKEEDSLEIKNLAADARFNKRDYVTEGGLKYYYGVPLKTANGHHIGSLCVLDENTRHLSAEQKEMLQIIGKTIISRLDNVKQVELLKTQNRQLENSKRMVAHDIRGPIAGIIGLTQLIIDQGDTTDLEELLELTRLIKQSGSSVLELANDILNVDIKPAKGQAAEHLITLVELRDKILNLFTPRVKDKGIELRVNISAITAGIAFVKGKLQQIIGNLVSNAVKFTPTGGQVTVGLELTAENEQQHILHITVSDTGVGMDSGMVDMILNGTSTSTAGTNGEVGYGLGLALVKQLVQEYEGKFELVSHSGSGTIFTIHLPLPVEI